MVCVREFISEGSFLLEERCLLRFLKKFFSNAQLEGSESLMALVNLAVLV